jgi:phosphoenolpyruvate carboxylase
MLPSWFGAGTALQAAAQEFGNEVLAEMFHKWYFFEEFIDQVEMGLARADLGMAHYYEQLAGPEYQRVADVIRAEYELTREHVLRLKGCAFLLDSDPTMQRTVRLRNPYLDPVHLMQVDLLKRWRATGSQDRQLLQALLASINAIGQGLQGST